MILIFLENKNLFKFPWIFWQSLELFKLLLCLERFWARIFLVVFFFLSVFHLGKKWKEIGKKLSFVLLKLMRAKSLNWKNYEPIKEICNRPSVPSISIINFLKMLWIDFNFIRKEYWVYSNFYKLIKSSVFPIWLLKSSSYFFKAQF